MTAAERWLHAFAHAIAAWGLYAPDHQARKEAGARLQAAVEELLAVDSHPAFTFLEDAVIYGVVPLHGIREWPWSERLAAIGVRRVELTRDATREVLEQFLDALLQRLGSGSRDPLPVLPGLAAGDIAVRTGQEDAAPIRPTDLTWRLDEEVAAVQYAFSRVAGGNPLPLDDVEAVVRALAVAMRSEGELLIPLLALQSLDDHAALHAVNTAILAMTFSEWLGLSGGDIKEVGKAALLHDIGMARVRPEVFRESELSAEGRDEVQRHPSEGARMLIARSAKLDLAATAAYEHHLRADGAGYPHRRFHTDMHYISRIVSVCGAYDALRSDRSYRPARDAELALQEIERGAGTTYDPGIAHAFVQMMRRWENRLVTTRLSERKKRKK